MRKMDFDLIIIGGGPAGLTAGIYAVRRDLKTLVIEKAVIGGQMQLTTAIENWPGEKLIAGAELSKRMEEQAKDLCVVFEQGEVTGLSLEGEQKKVQLAEKSYTCSAVLLAMGGKHRLLGVKGELDFAGKGVSYCATCDAPFFREKTVAVVGGGNTAVEDAHYLSQIAGKTYLIHRRDQFRAEQKRIDDLKKEGVEFITDTVVEEFQGENLLSQIKLKNLKTNQTSTLDVDGVFVSIGVDPASEIALENGVMGDGRGFIQVDTEMKTNLEGVYAAGDVTGGVMQIPVACAQGCTAALSAYEQIQKPYWKR